jgi:hypothetical protein
LRRRSIPLSLAGRLRGGVATRACCSIPHPLSKFVTGLRYSPLLRRGARAEGPRMLDVEGKSSTTLARL